jgi:hypothetical protein
LGKFKCLTHLTVFLGDDTIYALELLDNCPALVSVDVIFDLFNIFHGGHANLDDYNLDSVVLPHKITQFKTYGAEFTTDSAKYFMKKFPNLEELTIFLFEDYFEEYTGEEDLEYDLFDLFDNVMTEFANYVLSLKFKDIRCPCKPAQLVYTVSQFIKGPGGKDGSVVEIGYICIV